MACIGYLSRPTFLRTAVGATASARARPRARAYSAAPSSSESERVLTIMGANCAVATTLIPLCYLLNHICVAHLWRVVTLL